MEKENSIKIIISKDYWKIDRNFKCKIIFLSASNFIFIHKKFIQRQKRLHSIKQKIFKKKVIRMTPMTKNENLISFDNLKIQLLHYVITLLHCYYIVITLLVITLLCENQNWRKKKKKWKNNIAKVTIYPILYP